MKPFGEHVEGLTNCGETSYAVELAVQNTISSKAVLGGVIGGKPLARRACAKVAKLSRPSSAVSSCERAAASSILRGKLRLLESVLLEESYALLYGPWHTGTVVALDLQSLDIQASLPCQRGGALAHQVNIDLLGAIINAHRALKTSGIGSCRPE